MGKGTCRKCGKGNLDWVQVSGRWQLQGWYGIKHQCPDDRAKYNPVPASGRKRCVIMTLDSDLDDNYIEWLEGNHFLVDSINLDRRHSELLPLDLPFSIKLTEFIIENELPTMIESRYNRSNN